MFIYMCYIILTNDILFPRTLIIRSYKNKKVYFVNFPKIEPSGKCYLHKNIPIVFKYCNVLMGCVY